MKCYGLLLIIIGTLLIHAGRQDDKIASLRQRIEAIENAPKHEPTTAPANLLVDNKLVFDSVQGIYKNLDLVVKALNETREMQSHIDYRLHKIETADPPPNKR